MKKIMRFLFSPYKDFYKVVIGYSFVYVLIIVLFALLFQSKQSQITMATETLERDNSELVRISIIKEFNKYFRNIIPDDSLPMYMIQTPTESLVFSFLLNEKIKLIEETDESVINNDTGNSKRTVSKSSSEIQFKIMGNDRRLLLFKSYLVKTFDYSNGVTVESCGIAFNKTANQLTLNNALETITLSAKGAIKKIDTNSFFTISFFDNKFCEDVDRLISISTRAITFKRALYFSAITITTVGYGDFLPSNDFSRILAGLESVIGILFFGIFSAAAFTSLTRQKTGVFAESTLNG